MKKNYLLVLVVALGFMPAMAENEIPNASFETWETVTLSPPYSMFLLSPYDEPEEWGTLNAFGINVTQSIDAFDGSYSAKLVSAVLDMTSIGMGPVTTSTMMSGDYTSALTTGEPVFGFPYTNRPYAFKFWYKYTPVNSDTAQVNVGLEKWNAGIGKSETIGRARLQITETVSEWTQATIFFEYDSEENPDTCIIDITSSLSPISKNGERTNVYGQVGSTLYIDKLEFDMTSDIQPISTENWRIWSDNTSLSVEMPARSGVTDLYIYSAFGQLVRSETLTQNVKIDISDLAAGVYLVQVFKDGSQLTKKIQKR